VTIVISFDTAAINVKKIIDQIMKQFAKKGRLNYVMRFYLGNLKVVILGTAPSAFCRYRLNPLHLRTFDMGCCSKIICDGCAYTNRKREIEARLVPACQFCRHPTPKSQEEFDKINFKRIAANDPVAMRHIGMMHCNEGDIVRAFEYYAKAAELGDAEAHYSLSVSYLKGDVEKDKEKEIYHLEEAAIAGHPQARFMLGCYEHEKVRTAKHWILAANLGHEKSMQGLKECYKDGKVSKEDFAAALRAHQAAVDATKSPQREVAVAFVRKYG